MMRKNLIIMPFILLLALAAIAMPFINSGNIAMDYDKPQPDMHYPMLAIDIDEPLIHNA